MASWTADDVATLRAAVASGILTVKYAGPPAREITYHGLAEMRSLLAEMTRDVAAAAGATAYRRVKFRRGFRGADE